MIKMTELEALNRMLLGIQMAPLASIDDIDTYSEAMIARAVLRQVLFDVVSPGWNFNTRLMTLSPVSDGTIPVPDSTMDVFVLQSSAVEYMVIQGKLVSMSTGVNTFSSPVTLYVVLGFDWEDLPVVIQSLVLHKARLAFKTEMNSELGADTQVILKDISDAETRVKAWDTRQKRMSMLDSLKTARHVNRDYPRRF